LREKCVVAHDPVDMVRRSKRVALLALAVVAVVGFPAVGVGDPGGATSRASASGPLTTDLLTTTELLTTEETTTLTETTTETSTTETSTTTTEETTTTVDDPTNGTDDLTNETDDGPDPTDDVENSTGDLNSTDDLTNATTETDELANQTDELTNATDELTDATDSLESVSTVGAQTHFSVTASSFTGTATGTLEGDVAVTADSIYSDPTEESSPSDSEEAGTTTASDGTAAADDDSSGTTASASGASDRSPDRDKRGIPAGGPEAVVGVGALTAAALIPQLADALTLAGNAGGMASASSAVFGSTVSGRRALRSRFDRFWRFVAPFRYSRWDNSDPLDHEVREALYEAIERSPGGYLSEISDRADVALSTARHHLDVLEEEGLVTTAKVRGKRRYYPDYAPDVELTAALEDEGTAEVLDALARLGASHGGRLADELDRDASTVSHHLSRLEDAGLVEREREGRAVVNRLAPEVRAVLRGGEDGETPAVAD
jgi:DNA-binding transcriptional ArsR family regulator